MQRRVDIMTRTTFGDILSGLRQARGLSIDALATACSVDRSTVSRWERSLAPAPDRAVIARLVAALDLDLHAATRLHAEAELARVVTVDLRRLTKDQARDVASLARLAEVV
jgi:transcriptional regulator with XRE-family HTH domain